VVVVGTSVPYALTRLGVLMSPREGDELEEEGVLNPATGRDPDGRMYLLPRIVAKGNVSRVGIAEIELTDGVPTGVDRQGVVMAPDRGWEHGAAHAGTEDPRITWIPRLGHHVMTYVAYGPLGPRLALATSPDLHNWRRLGPPHFHYVDELDVDLNLYANKDAVFFPEPVPGPDGRLAYAMLHRPMWHLGWIREGEGTYLPAGIIDDRPSIWISYAAADDVERDVTELVQLRDHRLVALPEFEYEAVKIGAGPPPIRVDEGWLLLHHGASGIPERRWGPQQDLRYAAGAMLLDPADPALVLARTPEPLLEPITEGERFGIVPNVVFPTAIEQIHGVRYVFYGMADSRIGVARLDHLTGE
jgi:beta-1,2-mannobiose phosphorylase / 1,2-beta-oligomannan phosphorylase